ncbi:MAG: PQQ-like beta-propeller repeat protein [Bacteroidales bacterium]|nr:PQQ-like beta-propeller repeat protein [Bacteroidales bacterium]
MKQTLRSLSAIGFFIFTVLTVVAQSNPMVINREKVVGKDYLTNSDIVAREYVFPENIIHTYVDTTTNQLTAQLRSTSKNGKYLKKNGKIVLYDLTNNDTKWSKKINYQLSSIQQFGDVLIQKLANKSTCLNSKNGETKWVSNSFINFADNNLRIGIGYTFNSMSGFSNSLRGIDFENGNLFWERYIDHEYGWNDIFPMNDSVVMIVSSGLHTVNLLNGDGWDYNAVTGAKDYTGTIAANAAGLALGLLTGSFVVTTGYDMVSELVSNVIVDSNAIYFASKEEIVCLNQDGQTIWSRQFPKKMASKSSIFAKDGFIYMINEGAAVMGYGTVDYGTPFIAAFDKITGEQLFLTLISDKKDQINGFKINNDTAILLFNDRISTYSLMDGTNLAQIPVNTDETGVILDFIGKQVYLEYDSAFSCPKLSDPWNHYIYTKSGKTIVMNDRFEILDQIDRDLLYIRYLSSDSVTFLSRDNETTIIDNQNKKIAVLQLTDQPFLIGSRLFYTEEKSIFEIDINEFIKH